MLSISDNIASHSRLMIRSMVVYKLSLHTGLLFVSFPDRLAGLSGNGTRVEQGGNDSTPITLIINFVLQHVNSHEIRNNRYDFETSA